MIGVLSRSCRSRCAPGSRRRSRRGRRPAKSLAWPPIAAGENVLLIAPTGTGKTLAAFLAVLDRLFRERRGRDARPRPALRLRLAAAEPQLRHRAQPGRAAGGDRPSAGPGRQPDPGGRTHRGHLGLRASQAPRRPAARADHHAGEPLAAPEPGGLAGPLADRRAPHHRRGPCPGADEARGRPGRLAGAGRGAGPARSRPRGPLGDLPRRRVDRQVPGRDLAEPAASSKPRRPRAPRRPSSPSRA